MAFTLNYALEKLTDRWGPVQIYPAENMAYEVRLPKYDKTENLMKGNGETLGDAVLDVAGKIADIEGKDLEYFGIAKPAGGQGAELKVTGGTMEGTADVKTEDEEPVEGFLYASPGGGGKNHIFGKDGESLCGRATLPEDFEGEVESVGERAPDTETDCKICVEKYAEKTAEEQAGE